MKMSMVSGKSTRWDCDVTLWRGIPDSFPSFHGWRNNDISGSNYISGSNENSEPIKDARFYVCHHCNSYVPETDVPNHPCWGYTERDEVNKTPSNIVETSCDVSDDDGYVCEWDDWRKEKKIVVPKPKYVIVTDENSVNGFCFLCKDRLHMRYDEDDEEWIYPECIISEGDVVHEECHSLVYG